MNIELKKRTKEYEKAYYEGFVKGLERAKFYYTDLLLKRMGNAYKDQIDAEIDIYNGCIRRCSELDIAPPNKC